MIIFHLWLCANKILTRSIKTLSPIRPIPRKPESPKPIHYSHNHQPNLINSNPNLITNINPNLQRVNNSNAYDINLNNNNSNVEILDPRRFQADDSDLTKSGVSSK